MSTLVTLVFYQYYYFTIVTFIDSYNEVQSRESLINDNNVISWRTQLDEIAVLAFAEKHLRGDLYDKKEAKIIVMHIVRRVAQLCFY